MLLLFNKLYKDISTALNIEILKETQQYHKIRTNSEFETILSKTTEKCIRYEKIKFPDEKRFLRRTRRSKIFT